MNCTNHDSIAAWEREARFRQARAVESRARAAERARVRYRRLAVLLVAVSAVVAACVGYTLVKVIEALS